jgi:hypothetical protein
MPALWLRITHALAAALAVLTARRRVSASISPERRRRTLISQSMVAALVVLGSYLGGRAGAKDTSLRLDQFESRLGRFEAQMNAFLRQSQQSQVPAAFPSPRLTTPPLTLSTFPKPPRRPSWFGLAEAEEP